MAKRKRETAWSFLVATANAQRALRENNRMSSVIAMYKELSNGQAPQSQGRILAQTFGVERRCELFSLLSDIGQNTASRDEIWHRLHLMWRYDAVHFRVYIERLEQLARANPEKARLGRLPIGDVDCFLATQFLMSLAFSIVVGEDHAADWLGRKCLAFFREPQPYVKEDAFTLGPVAPFLMKLYGLWRGVPVDLESKGITLLRPFQDIFDTWNDPASLEDAVLRLCELHAWKAVNYDLADNDMIVGLQSGHHKGFPSEILFIQRIRRDLGLSVPNHEHPLLRSPLMQMPFPCPKSGYDPWIAMSLEKIKADMPDLRIEWEEEFQKLGPTDPNRLPETDFVVE